VGDAVGAAVGAAVGSCAAQERHVSHRRKPLLTRVRLTSVGEEVGEAVGAGVG
jgi:hypothetical protein